MRCKDCKRISQAEMGRLKHCLLLGSLENVNVDHNCSHFVPRPDPNQLVLFNAGMLVAECAG